MTARPAVTLTATTLRDFPTLRALFDDPAFHGWGGAGRLSDEEIRAKYLGARWPSVECYLVRRGEVAIGLAQLHAADHGAAGCGGIDLILLSAARGRGAGRAAVEELVRRARDDLGWSRVTVDPDADNGAGIRFWSAVGFEPARDVPGTPERGPHLLMERSLDR